MQPEVQRSGERGDGSQGWLQSRFSFSFAGWHDARHMGWGPLRVLNEDRIAPRSGFGPHPHREMEIVTYVLAGAIRHRDSMGSDGVVRPGQAQRMSAGTGVTHSEWNDGDEETHLLQVWLLPRATSLGSPPGYEQKTIPDGALEAGWHVLAEGRPGHAAGPGTVTLQQDAAMLVTRADPAATRRHAFAAGRLGYLFVIAGEVQALGNRLRAGDALRFAGVAELDVAVTQASHLLLFDLPAGESPR